MEDNTKQKILDKIQKLLKLQHSAENLGNEGEAYAAATAVHRLLTTYNLSLQDIVGTGEEDSNIIKSDDITYRSQFGCQWKLSLLTIVADNNYCSVLVKSYKQHMLIVGHQDNVEVVKTLYSYLVSAFNKLSVRRRAEFSAQLREENKRLTEAGKKKFMRSYYIGAVAGLLENFNSHKPTSEETGLMICHKTEIEKYLSEDSTYNGKTFKGKGINKDLMLEGVLAGENDGRNINLNRQIQCNYER
ncbi:DUF2786 domain-containing protein [Porphyromonas somerae]|uniref:DUF2786 domain-containing protein n=1 Tax=Porphyromonas somerae TaxID=322095 RepID=UPI001FCC857A|nr:DUF2786 domain-containing protein [Porphyromonas somerae]BDE81902.1 hypothetical protein CE91St14_09300 [Porphyromonas somerae]